MATITITLPDPLNDWIETQVRQGEFASGSDYLRELVSRDRESRAADELSLADLTDIVAASRASGISEKSVSTILSEAKSAVRTRRAGHG